MPDFSDASDAQLAFIPETTWGVTPATPAFQRVRMTGENLVFSIDNQMTNEIDPTSSVKDLIQRGASATGGFDFELSYGTEFNTLLEHALRADFALNTLKGGTDKKSLTIEKAFQAGGTTHYQRFLGLRVNTLQVNVRAQELVTGRLDLLGSGADPMATTIITGATYANANTNEVMASPEVASITVANTVGTIFFTDLSFTLTNNLRAQAAIGQLGAAGIGYGRREITGQMNAYFEDADLYEEFISGTAGSLSFALSDGTNSYAVTFPRSKFTTGQVVASGNNTDVMAEMGFQALYDDTAATDIQIDKSS